MWKVEQIPDEDTLFKRVHAVDVRDGEPIPNAFKDIGGGMSTNWNKYATAEYARQRARNPERNGVISLLVGKVRDIEGLTVQHSPSHDDRSHTDVLGEKDVERRAKLLRIFKWEIRIS